MKLLLDANISWRLIPILKQHFSDCLHVEQTNLPKPATDSEIWKFAKDNNLLIVTNDEDFLDMINLKGFPPKIILLRTGNQSNSFVCNLLIRHKDDIESLSNSSETGLLEIF